MTKAVSKISVGYRIRKSRKEVGYSQKELAKALNISDKTISSYEVNRAAPSFATLKKISRLVHKPINYFDENADADELDLQIKIKNVEREIGEIKRLLEKQAVQN